ncbi:hypothetical protein AAHA92_10257 [Salvia divinorum]|uniref:Uncharacterized protein n=1 Tax=Salvia divinorum TaxID=28513 RepID=A0ABD1HWM8_SALDI
MTIKERLLEAATFSTRPAHIPTAATGVPVSDRGCSLARPAAVSRHQPAELKIVSEAPPNHCRTEASAVGACLRNWSFSKREH